MFLDDFHQFLIKQSGITGKIVNSFLEPDSQGPAFFKPWESKVDPLIRSVSIFTAPVCITLLAAEFALLSVIIAIKSLFELFMEGPATAKESAIMSANCILVLAISLVCIFASPFVNVVDLIGGGVNLGLQQCDEEDYGSEPSF